MSEENMYIVSSSPHSSAQDGTGSIMLDVIIALTPALIVSVFFFGMRALTLTLVSAAACIAFEWIYRRLMKKTSSVHDLSAVVTGILLAYNLPVNAPYWICIVGAAFAIIIVKQLYGGIGKNFMNPALTARAFLFSWPAIMNTFPAVFTKTPVFGSADAVTAATPLAALKTGALPDFSLVELFLGKHGGSLGETSALILLLGGVYLVLRRVISPRIPLCYIGTVAVITFIFPRGGNAPLTWMLYNLLSGGLMLGAIFMATDYSTSPITKTGKTLFGIGCGLLTVFIRYFGSYYEGVSYAILIMNACVWLLDKSARPRRYGLPRGKEKEV
ncbi:MAG: RnfABCDGE type electron transport complex subunit D [Oscillospiraceae bacterium]|jgi:electron transport complex protein RnfD|nr:RnfABCDGE type electron transport complex subunit D [Oscillospiraceae bacterium]